MTELNSILLVTRATSRDSSAVQLAMRLARDHGARLTIADTVGQDGAGEAPGSGSVLRRLQQRRRVREMESLSDHEPFGFLPVVCALEGERIEAVLNLISFGDYELVIVDTAAHGGERMSRDDIERLERGCSAPLLLMPADGADRIRRVAVAIDPEDESALTTSCLDLAARLSRGGQVKLHLVSAYQPLAAGLLGKRDAVAAERRSEQIEGWVRERQLDLVDSLGLDAEILRLDQLRGRIHEVLPDYAATRDIDIVIVGHKRRSGLLARIFGNSSEPLRERCHAAILTVPPQAPEAPRFEFLADGLVAQDEDTRRIPRRVG